MYKNRLFIGEKGEKNARKHKTKTINQQKQPKRINVLTE